MRTATQYYTRDLQTYIHGKDCYIVIVTYIPFQHRIQLQGNVSKSLTEDVKGGNPFNDPINAHSGHRLATI